MNNGIKNIFIDFEVYDSHNPKIIIIADTSEWSRLEDKPSRIEIIPPGYTLPITHTFAKHKLNTFNSQTLYQSCVVPCRDNREDLLDGLYSVCVKSASNKHFKQKWYLKTDNTQIKLDKALVAFDFEFNLQNEKKIKELSNINFLLKVAKAHTRLGDIPKANRYFMEAVSLLESFDECKDCF